MRVVRQLLVQPRVDGERAAIGQQQRVAVGRRLRDDVDAERRRSRPACCRRRSTGPSLAHLLRERARGEVGCPAWREGHDETDRLRRIRLRESARRRERADRAIRCFFMLHSFGANLAFHRPHGRAMTDSLDFFGERRFFFGEERDVVAANRIARCCSSALSCV